MATNRAKFGYLNYADMISLINSRKLNAHDIVFGKDTKEQYWISPELEPVPVHSRVLCFDSTTAAYKELNKDTATYDGQIVAIKVGTNYEGHIVNTNTAGKYYVTPIGASGDIDYNTITNRPIENLVGTLDKPVVIEELNSGIYKVSGQYRITTLIETVFLSSIPNLFFVSKYDTHIDIKQIDTDNTVIYSILNGQVLKKTVVTDDMLGNFASRDYIDSKIAALDFLTKDDIKEYVDELLLNTVEEMVTQKVEEVFEEVLDERIDSRIEVKLSEAEIAEDSIDNLFV